MTGRAGGRRRDGTCWRAGHALPDATPPTQQPRPDPSPRGALRGSNPTGLTSGVWGACLHGLSEVGLSFMACLETLDRPWPVRAWALSCSAEMETRLCRNTVRIRSGPDSLQFATVVQSSLCSTIVSTSQNNDSASRKARRRFRALPRSRGRLDSPQGRVGPNCPVERSGRLRARQCGIIKESRCGHQSQWSGHGHGQRRRRGRGSRTLPCRTLDPALWC